MIGGILACLGTLAAGPVGAADTIVGYTGPAPSNAYSFDIEGCRLEKATEGTYDPTATPPVLTCDTVAVWPDGADAYTDGNLGKEWNELDLVPHRIGSDSSGAAGTETFQVIVGADNQVDDSPLKIGYDLVTNFKFNAAVSTGTAAECQMTLVGGNQVGDFGIGGAMKQIVQVLQIKQVPDVRCVWDYVEQLAITSSLISGSSNRSFIVAGTGAQSVPIPSDIQPQVLSKTMSAVEDSLVKWTIKKDANPVKLDFGNTCDATVPNEGTVSIKIDYTRGTAEPNKLTATSLVKATNPSSRDVTYQCTDKLYSGTTLLDTQSKNEVVEPGMETIEIVHEVAPGTRSLRNELSCGLYVDNILGGDPIFVGTLNASFTLPDAAITAGTVVNNAVKISDSEDISGTGFSFKTGNPTGTTGGFDGYTAGQWVPTDVSGPVKWTSDPQSATGSITFTKTVRVNRFINTSGTLSDKATLPLSGTTDVEATASTSLSADPRVKLTIKKTIPDILQGAETIACKFDVTGPGGYATTKTLNFAAGDTFKSDTLTNLMPGNYTVTEKECGGLTPVGSSVANVDLTLAGATGFDACSADASFTNQIPGDGYATAQVNKKTLPKTAGSTNLGDGWTMTLKGDTDGDTQYDDVVITLVTADSNQDAYEPFLDSITKQPYQLPEGKWMIVETLKSGWTNIASAGDCSFTVDYPADFDKTFSCQYTNELKGKVIIEKQTLPDGETDLFEFTQDVDVSGNFKLADNGTKMFTGVKPNDPSSPYQVVEIDPTPGYDLTGLICTDDFDKAGYNVNSSTVDKDKRLAKINVDPGETVKCVFTNTKRGMAQVLKLTNGLQDPSMKWTFSLSGPGVNETDSTPPALMDFGGAKLVAGETYKVCETGIPPTWTSSWKIDTDGDGTADTIIPFVAAVNDDPVDATTGFSRVFDPNYVAPPAQYTNDTRCVKFVAKAGKTTTFEVDNTRPGGDPRTIGYWKNWNTCSGGNQYLTAAANGGPAEGWFLLDDLLNNPGFTIGLLQLDANDCGDAVSILDKRDIKNGRKKASDPAYGLAAQLLAAVLNLSAGAESCQAAVNAVNAGQAVLVAAGFDGTGDYFKGKNALEGSQANSLASTLDDYNNGFLCN